MSCTSAIPVPLGETSHAVAVAACTTNTCGVKLIGMLNGLAKATLALTDWFGASIPSGNCSTKSPVGPGWSGAGVAPTVYGLIVLSRPW